MLIRCGEPSKYDHAPCGTICKVNKPTSDEFEIYIQLSADESDPCWEKLGDFTAATIVDALEKIVDRILGSKSSR
jgi:hypothetical protein